MRFCQLDRIDELQPGVRITATKELRAEEEYLKDHFPLFPVMPGVLMLEAMFQASMFLVRRSEDFEHGMVVLKEARNVKYADFVEPGQVLRVSAEILKQDERLTTLRVQGEVAGNTAVSARLILERYDLAEEDPRKAPSDRRLRREMEQYFTNLSQPLESLEAVR